MNKVGGAVDGVNNPCWIVTKLQPRVLTGRLFTYKPAMK